MDYRIGASDNTQSLRKLTKRSPVDFCKQKHRPRWSNLLDTRKINNQSHAFTARGIS